MNFLVDAQLPRRMTGWLTAAGCDAVHTAGAKRGIEKGTAHICDP
jgi:predicted nuclease of predicted toxin-antitoxin system